MPISAHIAVNFSKVMNAQTITPATFTLKQGITPVAGTVTYAGVTGTFNPADNLEPNTQYTAMISTGARDPAGLALANNHTWRFTTDERPNDDNPPRVISLFPADGAQGVPIGATIAVNFSLPMKAQTITPASFSVKRGTTPVAGTLIYAGATATFNPSSKLATNTKYTATITAGARDLEGWALTGNSTWSFTTGAASDNPAPGVISASPANGAISVPVTANIAVNFSKAMNAQTITPAIFTLKQGTMPVAGGTVTYAGVTATFRPPSNLKGETKYTATITTGARDPAGKNLVREYTWSFTTNESANGDDFTPTVISTFPVNKANGVPIAANLAINFSEAMNPQTFTTAVFTLKRGATSVAGKVTYDGVTATYSPTSKLANNTLYTAVVKAGARDLDGNALTRNHTWSFVTLPTAGQATIILGQAPLYLGWAADFAVLAGATVTNVPTNGTTLYGDLGVSPGTAVGFPPGIVHGTIHAGQAISDRYVATRAQADLATAYYDAAGRFTAPIGVSGDIGGRRLYPGLYRSSSSLTISSGDLTLDARGDPNAVWIFQIASTLTTLSGRKVILAGGAQAANIFWQVGSSATLGTTSVFKGTILANASITLRTGARLDGRALARSGAVTLDGNVVTAVLPLARNISRLGYATGWLEAGRQVYADRDYVFDDPIPPYLNGQATIGTLNNEKGLSNSNFLAFDVNQPVTVFVALDERIISRPGWLAGWTQSGDKLRITDVSGPTRALYSRSFPAGRVTLGPNWEAGGPTSACMYSVILVPGSGSAAAAKD